MLKMTLIIIVVLPVALFMPIILNGVSLFDQPGFTERTRTYFTQNVAQTATNHLFPELRPRIFDADREKMFQLVVQIAQEQGWEVIRREQDNYVIAMVISSRLWHFKDDMTVRMLDLGGRTELQLESHSRVGKGDFGANLAHIEVLLREIEEKGV